MSRTIEITNPRAEREWAYLVQRVGLERAQKALEALHETRRAFPLNVARQLGVELPSESELPLVGESLARSKEAAAAARERLASIRQQLARGAK